MTRDSRLTNFRALTPARRLQHLVGAGVLNAADAELIGKPGALGLERADGMI